MLLSGTSWIARKKWFSGIYTKYCLTEKDRYRIVFPCKIGPEIFHTISAKPICDFNLGYVMKFGIKSNPESPAKVAYISEWSFKVLQHWIYLCNVHTFSIALLRVRKSKYYHNRTLLCVYIHFSCVIIISINGIIRFRHANSCNRYVLHFIYFALRCPTLDIRLLSLPMLLFTVFS